MDDKWARLGEWRRGKRLSSSPTISSSASSPHLTLMTYSEDYVHAISQIQFHHRPSKDLPGRSPLRQDHQDHLIALDGLALLLVFSPKSDVAAITFWQSADELKLFWAKNQPVNDKHVLQYIQDLLDSARRGAKTGELLYKVISMCRYKIFQRIKKLAKSFNVSQSNQRDQESNLWKFDGTNESCQKLEMAVKKAGWLKKQSTIARLDSFTRFVGKATRTDGSRTFWNILYFAWTVTTATDLNELLEAEQVRYLSKLSDYVRILDHIPTLLKKAGKAKISIEQVRPPIAKPVEVYSGSLEVLNIRCAELDIQEMTKIDSWDMVTNAYPSAEPGQPTVGRNIVNFTQHCELTLALKMFELHTGSKFTKLVTEIGVSKACCEWCYRYLNRLASTRRRYRVLVRASHGKQPDGWMIPPNSPTEVAKGMRVEIEDKLDDIVWKIQGRRRSDSNELPADFVMDDIDYEAVEQAIEESMIDFE